MNQIDYDNPKGVYDLLEASNKHSDNVATKTFIEAEHIYIRKGRLFVGLHKDSGFEGVTENNQADYQFNGHFHIKLKGTK